MAQQAELTDLADLAEQFDRSRSHLRAVAFRMLGSLDEADDAVQDAWLRASRVGAGNIANVAGWLTTIVGRVCLDMLRARRRQSVALVGLAERETHGSPSRATDPAEQAVAAESVGLALLVVLDRLGPAERVAFVLHDLFAVPFDEIAQIVGRSTVAAKKLASRARQRVHGTAPGPAAEPGRQRAVVDAFLAAARAGDLEALIAVLAPDVVRRADPVVLHGEGAAELRGARSVATETLANVGLARFARSMLVDGRVGVIVAPSGRLMIVLKVAVEGDRIAAIDVIGEPSCLRAIPLAMLDPAVP
jgi:RNA polymerase sigma-70 factor (ECF subfamily)